jgi:hypothetical protein
MEKNTMRSIALVVGLLFFYQQQLFPQKKGDDYSVAAGDAAWCWYSDPRAVYHHGKYEKMYYGYISSKGDVMISSMDVRSARTETFILHPSLQVDDHNVPSMLVLPDGRLLVFYTEHNGRFFMRKSSRPEDISSWEEERVIPFGGTRITYSHPVMLAAENNRIYMFWRGSDWRPSFAYSDDLGETWSKTQALIESKGSKNRPYLKVSTDSQSRIDFAFTDGHPQVEPTNSVYHMYYENGSFYQTDGVRLASISDAPVSHASIPKVYDGVADRVRGWIYDVALDDKKRPVLVYVRYPANDDHRYHYAHWNGKRWNDEELCAAGRWMPQVPPEKTNREPFYSGGLMIDRNNPSHVILSRQKEGGRFEIESWTKKHKKWRVLPITERSSDNNVRPYAITVAGKKEPLILWMYGYYGHYIDFRTVLRTNIGL